MLFATPGAQAATRTGENDMSSACPHCGEAGAAELSACPACGYLYTSEPCATHGDRAAIAQCALCGTPVCKECAAESGRTYLCPDHRGIPVVEGWAQVYTTSSDIDAGLIRDNLQAEGIDARVLSQKDHFSFTVDLGDLSQVRVLVPSFAFRDALDLVRSHLDVDGDVHFACPNCGDPFEAGETTCSACGAPLRK
jgi:hypothetical protein